MESRALVVEWLSGFADSSLAGAESTEVLGRLGDCVGVKLHHDAAGGFVANGHVEINFRVNHFVFERRFERLGFWCDLAKG